MVRPSAFKFKATDTDCDTLQEAFKRYHRVVSVMARSPRARRIAAQNDAKAAYKPWLKDRKFRGYLDSLKVQLLEPCEHMPYLGMDERYELHIDSPSSSPGSALLRTRSIWGALRGLETFSQLLTMDTSGAALIVNSTSIEDFPQYPHRGLLLDTSRHFLPVGTILQTLSAMEANKLNVLHWHIVDDQSFPYQSSVFPELSAKGAYDPASFIYTHVDIKNVIEHARLRGIRVIAEFDTPGHTSSWGGGLPQLLTPCYMGDEPDGTYGPINPIHDETYKTMEIFLKEAVDVFNDKYIHLGGDEVSFDCWASNPDILSYMESRNMSTDFTKLESMYVQRLIDITNRLNASSIVWQEVFDNGVRLPSDTVVHLWTKSQKEELSKVTKAGHRALLSTCWYLDHLESGGDWQKFYMCDPHDFDGTDEDKKRVIGGEACMWGEVVDETNIHSRVWPRASATAEKLWSSIVTPRLEEAAHRLEEHTCRMKRRGIPAQPPNGPGFCPV